MEVLFHDCSGFESSLHIYSFNVGDRKNFDPEKKIACKTEMSIFRESRNVFGLQIPDSYDEAEELACSRNPSELAHLLKVYPIESGKCRV